jgi:hypothetical protein
MTGVTYILWRRATCAWQLWRAAPCLQKTGYHRQARFATAALQSLIVDYRSAVQSAREDGAFPVLGSRGFYSTVEAEHE